MLWLSCRIFCIVVLLLAATSVETTKHEPRFSFDLELETGRFRVIIDGVDWLTGGEYRVGNLSSSSKSLVPTKTQDVDNHDILGTHRGVCIQWASRQAIRTPLMETCFRIYDGFVVFEQYFPHDVDLEGLSTGSKLSARTIFPGFWYGRNFPCFSFRDIFANFNPCTLYTYKENLYGGVPLVLYNETDPGLPMVVLSPLSYPGAQQMALQPGSFFGVGVKSTVRGIPAGWRQSFILSVGSGINDGMMRWGDRMLQYWGKKRADNRYKDAVHGGIGFWTDNGGYYHYGTGDPTIGKNYEEVLPKVKAYHESIGVQFQHWQFDSWFYPKAGPVDKSGGGGPVINWTASPDVFPGGMSHIQSMLDMPMIMHNRHWYSKSDYIREWTDIEWYVTNSTAVPKDPIRFFERFFQQQEGWGLYMYEQDWMSLEYSNVEALHTNISLTDLWIEGMALGVEWSNRTMQLCMPFASHVLSAARWPSVTNARASGDYAMSDDQWAIGGTALMLWALNLLPFKDGFYSSNLKQVGGQNVGPELRPDRETLVATLSAAIVGPMDGIFLMNASRVRSTCRKDGTVLKPDKPLTTTDACFWQSRPACRVYHTYSDLQGLGRVHYYFNNNGQEPMRSEELYLTDSYDHAVYSWYSPMDVYRLSPILQVPAGYEGHIYAIVSPIVDNWALLGEANVYVATSSTRFKNVYVDKDALKIWVFGVKDEQIAIRAACFESGTAKIITKTVDFGDGGLFFTNFHRKDAQDIQDNILTV